MSPKILPYQKLELEENKSYETLLEEYKKNIAKAPEKFKAKAHYKYYYYLNDLHQKLQITLGIHSRFFLEIEDYLEDDAEKSFENEFNLKYLKIQGENQDVLLRNLAIYRSYEKLFVYLHHEEAKYNNKPTIGNLKEQPKIYWRGENMTEFTQFVYGLFHAGYLTNSSNEIEKLVEDVANAFNLKLSKNVQSNLSKSIHKSKAGYEPKIFKKIENAFKQYMDDLINKNNEN